MCVCVCVSETVHTHHETAAYVMIKPTHTVKGIYSAVSFLFKLEHTLCLMKDDVIGKRNIGPVVLKLLTATAWTAGFSNKQVIGWSVVFYF